MYDEKIFDETSTCIYKTPQNVVNNEWMYLQSTIIVEHYCRTFFNTIHITYNINTDILFCLGVA